MDCTGYKTDQMNTKLMQFSHSHIKTVTLNKAHIYTIITMINSIMEQAFLLGYLADGVLVLIEQRLQFQAFRGGQGSNLSISSDRHLGRLGQQTVEQTQQRERHQTALRCSDRRGERNEETEWKQSFNKRNQFTFPLQWI